MANLITGLVGIVLAVVFLGTYAITLNELPLWLIIVGVLLLAVADFVLSLRADKQEH